MEIERRIWVGQYLTCEPTEVQTIQVLLVSMQSSDFYHFSPGVNPLKVVFRYRFQLALVSICTIRRAASYRLLVDVIVRQDILPHISGRGYEEDRSFVDL